MLGDFNLLRKIPIADRLIPELLPRDSRRHEGVHPGTSTSLGDAGFENFVQLIASDFYNLAANGQPARCRRTESVDEITPGQTAFL